MLKSNVLLRSFELAFSKLKHKTFLKFIFLQEVFLSKTETSENDKNRFHLSVIDILIQKVFPLRRREEAKTNGIKI